MEQHSDERENLKKTLFSQLKVGDVRQGTVKNVAEFDALVDLGGIDGLLVSTEVRHGWRVHASEMVRVDEEVKVMGLSVDVENEKIEVGLMSRWPSPWEKVESTYTVGTRVLGEVVVLTVDGPFVRLEHGIEGLVRISDMACTKLVNHPGELVQIGDKVDVVVLGIDNEKQEISLGMIQTQDNR